MVTAVDLGAKNSRHPDGSDILDVEAFTYAQVLSV